jgi:hypothetical protein
LANDAERQVSGRVDPIEQPVEAVAVVCTEPTSELLGSKLTSSPLDSTIQQAHAGQRARIERAEPQQCRDVLASSPVEQQIVPAHEVCDKVTHIPAATQ